MCPTIINISPNGRCSQEKSSASRPTLRPERAGVDADADGSPTRLPERSQLSAYGYFTVYVTLQIMDSFQDVEHIILSIQDCFLIR